MIILAFDIMLFLSLTGLLVYTIRTGSKRSRYYLFTAIFLGVLNIAFTALFALSDHTSFPENYGAELLVCFCMALLSAIPLLIITILAILFTVLQKKRNKTRTSSEKNFPITKAKVFKTLGILALIILAVYGSQFGVYKLQYRAEVNAYNRTREEEIAKMTAFLNEKYSLNVQPDDCIYYREKDYTYHKDFLGNGFRYNVPFIGIFESGGQQITVTDRNGFISDNRQLEELVRLIPEYFKKETGLEIEYVQFEKSYLGSIHGDDNILNSVLQCNFNSLITEENLTEFMKQVFSQEDLSIDFYLKYDSDWNSQIQKVTAGLDYLKEYANIEKITVYFFEGNLDIVDTGINYTDGDVSLVVSENSEVTYEFGGFFVSPQKQQLVFSASMELDRGYTPEIGEHMNGWVIRSY